jgi:predicted signal transduction protein with EAL and GGDEF domain
VRPTTIIALVIGVVAAVTAVVLGAVALFGASGGKPWFYWLAPLLALGAGGLLVALGVGYWVRVGQLEVKGRPRSD